MKEVDMCGGCGFRSMGRRADDNQEKPAVGMIGKRVKITKCEALEHSGDQCICDLIGQIVTISGKGQNDSPEIVENFRIAESTKVVRMSEVTLLQE